MVLHDECGTLHATWGDSPAGACRVGSTISSLIGAAETGDSAAADMLFNVADPKELSAISDALHQLAKVDPRLHELVDMRFFCGFSFARIAALENLWECTVQRRWEKARIYLDSSVRADLPL